MLVSTHLKSLQALELALRTGSLKAAAEQLLITPAAVGQRIKNLEDYLGLDLLVRGRSGIRPTRELSTVIKHLNAAFKEIETVTKLLDFQKVHEIHIVAEIDWAELWLKPRLADFRVANPNTLFCINGIGDVPVRLGKVDCEIWFGMPRGRENEVELFHDYLLPVGSPENAKRLEATPREARLEGFPLIHLDCYTSDPASCDWPEWISKYGYRKTAAGRGLRYSHVIQALEAVYSSAGFLICGLALIQKQLDSGKLALPFAASKGSWTGNAYHVGFRESSFRRPQLERFRLWLLAQGNETTMQLERLSATN